jgi:hypothetical protein
MLVESVINKPKIQRRNTLAYPISTSDLFTLSRNLIKIAKERPLAASGAALTFISFLTAFVTKTPLKLMPFFGIPAIGLFALEIFSGKHPDSFVNPRRIRLDFCTKNYNVRSPRQEVRFLI